MVDCAKEILNILKDISEEKNNLHTTLRRWSYCNCKMDVVSGSVVIRLIVNGRDVRNRCEPVDCEWP